MTDQNKGNLPAVPPPPQYPVPVQVLPKSPAVAVIASFFLPGLGSMIAGQGGKGAAILVSYIVSVILCYVLIGIPFAVGLWIYGMVTASGDAKKWNAQHGIIS